MTTRDTARELVDELNDLHQKGIAARNTQVMDMVWEALNNLNDDLRFATDLPYRSLDMADVVDIRRMLPEVQWDADFVSDVERMQGARDAAVNLLAWQAGDAA